MTVASKTYMEALFNSVGSVEKPEQSNSIDELREEVCLAIDLAAAQDLAVCVNEAGTVLDEKEFASPHCTTLLERCNECLKHFLELCEHKQQSVEAICVLLSKEPECHDDNSAKILKGQIESRYQLCTEVIRITSTSEAKDSYNRQIRLAQAAKKALESKKMPGNSENAQLQTRLLSATPNLFVITGRPACGKTTFIASVIEELRQKGIRVGGITSLEVKKAPSEARTGFCMRLLSAEGTDTEVELARVGAVPGWVSFSRFSVCVENIDNIAVPILEKAREQAQVMVIDEVASMQMLSGKFQSFIKKLHALKTPIIISVTQSSRYEEICQLKTQATQDGSLITLDPNNKAKSQRQAHDMMMPLLYQSIQKQSAHEKQGTQTGSLQAPNGVKSIST